MSAVLLLADLHLRPHGGAMNQAFIELLDGPAHNAGAVFILGDLFEVWIGDRDGLAAYPDEIAALARLSAAGIPVFFQHGNRDFLVGKRFAAATGVSLLPDPVVRTLGGQPTLLSHGDLYCIDDIGYQKWRRFSRNPLAQRVFLSLPRALREKIAGGVQNESRAAKQDKAVNIMDVNHDAIAQALREHSTVRMIHGHTHRPALHALSIDDVGHERAVLGDWRTDPPQFEAMLVNEQGRISRITWPWPARLDSSVAA